MKKLVHVKKSSSTCHAPKDLERFKKRDIVNKAKYQRKLISKNLREIQRDPRFNIRESRPTNHLLVCHRRLEQKISRPRD